MKLIQKDAGAENFFNRILVSNKNYYISKHKEIHTDKKTYLIWLTGKNFLNLKLMQHYEIMKYLIMKLIIAQRSKIILKKNCNSY